MLKVGYRYKTQSGESYSFVDIIGRDESGTFEFKGAIEGNENVFSWYDWTGLPMTSMYPILDSSSGRPIPSPCACNKGDFQYHLKFCPAWENPITEGRRK